MKTTIKNQPKLLGLVVEPGTTVQQLVNTLCLQHGYIAGSIDAPLVRSVATLFEALIDPVEWCGADALRRESRWRISYTQVLDRCRHAIASTLDDADLWADLFKVELVERLKRERRSVVYGIRSSAEADLVISLGGRLVWVHSGAAFATPNWPIEAPEFRIRWRCRRVLGLHSPTLEQDVASTLEALSV